MIYLDGKTNFLHSTVLSGHKILHGFGTRILGDISIPENVRRIFENISVQDHTLFIQNQIHSANITVIEESEGEHYTVINETDGLITNQKNCILTAKTADCVPILFSDKVKGIIGISHQGWKGTIEMLPVKIIEKMVSMGCVKSDICAAVGPSINSCCYNIPESRADEFRKRFPEFADQILEIREGQTYLNLQRLNYMLLLRAGITKNSLDYALTCTSCDSKRFLSRRRDGAAYGNMISFVMMQ